MSVRESDMFHLSFLLFLRQMMLSLDILGSNVQRASAYRNLIRMFFFSFLFLYKERRKGTGKGNWPLWVTKHQFNKKDLTLKR